MYKARLSQKSAKSDYTYFEIIDTNVEIIDLVDGHIVSFKSRMAEPEYIVICTITGARNVVEVITKKEKIVQNKKVRKLSNNEYIKVFFKGRYGRVSNNPISLI